jgi:hypothetical protein
VTSGRWYFSSIDYYGHNYYDLFATTQGLKNFTLIDSFPIDINGMKFVNVVKGWAVADSGTIFHTEDGGYNWNLNLAE